jgi:hypothetical protein
MIVLKVPYAEKDEAKALGARWNPTRKCWYVPDGKSSEPFARWLAGGAEAATGADADAAPSSRDAFGAKPVIGKHYVELAHACNPFEECAECRPKLVESGWLAAHAQLRTVMEKM